MIIKSIFSFKNTLLCLLLCLATASSVQAKSVEHDQENSRKEKYKEVLSRLGTLPCMRSLTDPFGLDRIHELAYYAPQAIINNGQIVELFDSSKWYVNALQRHSVRAWVQSDIIFIKPNASCFSMYDYILYNQTTNEAVEVNFAGLPKQYQVFTQRIVKIDPYQGWIQLDDPQGTVWEIKYIDNRWRVGDYLMVGVNNDWRTSSYPHILINASIGGAPYYPASFYGYALD